MTVFKDVKIRRSRVAVLFACIAFLTTTAARAENDNDKIAAICDAWKRRYDATRSVHCVVTGKRLFPKDTYGAQADHEAPLSCTWKLDLQRNRFRFECRDETYREDKKAWLPQWEDTVFDGRIVKVHHAGITASRADWPDRQAEFAIHPSNYQCFLIFDCPVFLSLGIMPAYGTESNSTMRRPLYPETFTVHGRGTANGRECVILRSKPRQPVPRIDEYWVDLERGAVIMRWRQSPVSGERADIQCDIDYKEFSNGWQLSRFTTSSFTSDGKLVQRNQVSVTDFLTNADLDEATFELEPRAGMYFNDGIKLRLYQVAADGRLVAPPPLDGPMTSKLKGSKAPELSGKVWLNAKKPLGLRDLRGKPVLVVLFDLQEPAFIPLISPLLAYVDSYGEKGLSVIGVHRSGPRAEVEKLLTDAQITFPVLIDDGKTAARYKFGFSSCFLIDGDGKVVSGYKDLLVPPAEIESVLKLSGDAG